MFFEKLNKYSIYLILLLAAVTRLWQLSKRDFWYDEAFTGIAVKESWSGMLSMIKVDVHPPLYYLTLKFFASFFDYSVFGIRLYSAIFGVLCVWAVYIFTKELFNKKAAVYASLIAAISPFAWQYSQEGRMYSMFSFFIIMAALFLVKGLRPNEFTNAQAGKLPNIRVKDNKVNSSQWTVTSVISGFKIRKPYCPLFTDHCSTGHYILFGLFLGLASLTHYMGIFFAPIFYLVYVVNKTSVISYQCPVTRKQLLNLFKIILPDKKIIIGFIFALMVFAPWVPNFIRHIVKNATSNSLDWIRPANFGDIPINIQMFIFGTPLGEMSSGMPGPNEFYGIADISMWILVTIFITAVIIYLLRSVVIPSGTQWSRGIPLEFSKRDPSTSPEKASLGMTIKGRNDNKSVEIIIILILSLGFMVLIWLFGFFGKYFFVARYLLAAGYFIFVLLGVWLSRIRLPYSVAAITFYITMLFLTVPLGYSEGWNVFEKDLSKYKNNDFYILNSFDYVIAKYYVGADRLTLYNVDWPPYNPDYWAAIGKTLKRTENFEDLKNDKNALIISNTQLGGQDNVNFDPTGLELVAQYKNILIYKFQQ